MWMTPKRRGARAKFWFSMKTSKTCLGRPLPSRLVVSRFTNVPQLKRRCAVSKERCLASLCWIKAPQLFEGLRVISHLVRYNAHTPFVVVAHRKDMLCCQQALTLGAIDYLEKPVSSAEMNWIINNYFRRSLTK
jgi:FixJ family two-component response regulator